MAGKQKPAVPPARRRLSQLAVPAGKRALKRRMERREIKARQRGKIRPPASINAGQNLLGSVPCQRGIPEWKPGQCDQPCSIECGRIAAKLLCPSGSCSAMLAPTETPTALPLWICVAKTWYPGIAAFRARWRGSAPRVGNRRPRRFRHRR